MTRSKFLLSTVAISLLAAKRYVFGAEPRGSRTLNKHMPDPAHGHDFETYKWCVHCGHSRIDINTYQLTCNGDHHFALKLYGYGILGSSRYQIYCDRCAKGLSYEVGVMPTEDPCSDHMLAYGKFSDPSAAMQPIGGSPSVFCRKCGKYVLWGGLD